MYSEIPVRKVQNPLGDISVVAEALEGGIAEVYISEIKPNIVKGVKRHLKMEMRLTVISGTATFFFFDNGLHLVDKVVLTRLEKTILVKPKVWFAFKVTPPTSESCFVMNMPNILTADDLVERVPLASLALADQEEVSN